jgi:hypothetical protein
MPNISQADLELASVGAGTLLFSQCNREVAAAFSLILCIYECHHLLSISALFSKVFHFIHEHVCGE